MLIEKVEVFWQKSFLLSWIDSRNPSTPHFVQKFAGMDISTNNVISSLKIHPNIQWKCCGSFICTCIQYVVPVQKMNGLKHLIDLVCDLWLIANVAYDWPWLWPVTDLEFGGKDTCVSWVQMLETECRESTVRRAGLFNIVDRNVERHNKIYKPFS